MSRSALGRRRSADWELQQTASKGLDESRRSASVEATFAGLRFALGLGRPDDEKADDRHATCAAGNRGSLGSQEIGEHLPDKDLTSHMHFVVDHLRPDIDVEF